MTCIQFFFVERIFVGKSWGIGETLLGIIRGEIIWREMNGLEKSRGKLFGDIV
jgi:hypothetical protein